MPVAQKPVTNSQIRVFLAVGEATITRGQPVKFDAVVTDTSKEYLVKSCPDGARPDAVVTTSVDLGSVSGGLIQGRCMLSNLALLGGDCAAEDLLKVKGGKFVKCSVGDKGWFRAVFGGKTGDLILVEPTDCVA